MDRECIVPPFGMHSLLASLLLLCAVGAAQQSPTRLTPSLPRDGAKQQQSSDKKANTPDNAPKAPGSTTENQLSAPKKEQSPQQESQGVFEKAFAPETWPHWALFVAAIWAGIIALKTLKAIQREAEEAKIIAEAARDDAAAARDGAEAASKNAEAASLNAQAVINAERAWIVIAVSPTTTVGSYECKVLNYGRTPAAMTAQHVEFIYPTKEEEIPQAIKALTNTELA